MLSTTTACWGLVPEGLRLLENYICLHKKYKYRCRSVDRNQIDAREGWHDTLCLGLARRSTRRRVLMNTFCTFRPALPCCLAVFKNHSSRPAPGYINGRSMLKGVRSAGLSPPVRWLKVLLLVIVLPYQNDQASSGGHSVRRARAGRPITSSSPQIPAEAGRHPADPAGMRRCAAINRLSGRPRTTISWRGTISPILTAMPTTLLAGAGTTSAS